MGGLTLSFLIGCTALRPFHPSPLEALTESPGELIHSDFYLSDSVAVLQSYEVAGGQVLLYRWQNQASQAAHTYCLAATLVAPEGSGWRAQSTGFVSNEYPRRPPLFGCEIAVDDFLPSYFVGGNITPLTTAYGLSSAGVSVRITWSDGQIDEAPIKNGSFLLARPATLQVLRVELLDSQGQVLESEDWSGPVPPKEFIP